MDCEVCDHRTALNEISNDIETYYVCNSCRSMSEFDGYTVIAEADLAPYYPEVE